MKAGPVTGDAFLRWEATYDRAKAAACTALVSGIAVDWGRTDPEGLLSVGDLLAALSYAEDQVRAQGPDAALGLGLLRR